VKNRTTDFWVGVFVVLGVLALLFLALRAGNLASINLVNHTYEVRAKFDNIGSLKVRAPVRSAGVLVGRVGHIDFDNKSYQAVVTLDLNDNLHFPKDTAAKVLTSGLLGEQYVGLDPGGDPDMLASGDQVESTQSAVVLENLISQFLFSKAAEPAAGSANPGAGATSKAGAATTPAAAAKPSK
jgi:phospholipid/cholesterol/gamma-HCH transport system substrate-binding protein